MKYLVFKSCRGLDKPWLVFSPAERLAPRKESWSQGYETWHEAIIVATCLSYLDWLRQLGPAVLSNMSRSVQ